MGVVDFAVLGAVQKVRSFISDLSAAAAPPPGTTMPAGVEQTAACFERRRSRSPGSSPRAESPPARSGSRGAAELAARRQFSSPGPLRHCSFRQVDGEEDDEPRVQFFTPGNDFLHDLLDTDSVSVGTGNEVYRSMPPSPSESPGWMVMRDDATSTSGKNELFSQDSPDYGRKLITEFDDMREEVNGCSSDHFAPDWKEESHETQHSVDFDAHIWCPPPPEDEGDDVESGLFGLEDEDDEVGDSTKLFSPSSFSSNGVEATNGAHKGDLRNAVIGHFRALVAQLLKGEGVSLTNDDGSKGWLEIVSSLAWQAANFVKPDTKKGGSMDPSDYLKVKCLASGDPDDSNFIKGVVCSKNVRHKRMVSEHRNATLLILGGSLEYQKVPNRLASINTILEQEKEHLRMIVGKIEARRPNVLLVEKSVSSYAQELLAKDVSLVLNVKRPLLDRISRCTGAQIASSIDNISSARLGKCELFKVEKFLQLSSTKHPCKRSTKTLMFFEGCPRRLGCTVLLRGTCREELKRIKRAVHLAVFAAYQLSLQTSFLADEGATLPRVPSRTTVLAPQIQADADHFLTRPANLALPGRLETVEKHPQSASISMMYKGNSASPISLSLNEDGLGIGSEHKESGCYVSRTCSHDMLHFSCPISQHKEHVIFPDSFAHDPKTSGAAMQYEEPYDSLRYRPDADIHRDKVLEKVSTGLGHSENRGNHTLRDTHQPGDLDDQNEFSGDYFPSTDNNQSILVSLSSTCVPKSVVCQRSQLFRIKFYGSFDKPLGRYLNEDLFDQMYCCPSCKEPSESHVRCYTHQHGSLTISVRRLLSSKLPGERDGRIWMWHRCLKCKLKDGVPPATRRVIMSDAAWGLSFGKFLELSFSNHATANRIASCGHSLQRDCLRFYGYGNLVAFFRYSPVDILSVNLPPSVLDFNCRIPQEWMKREAVAISSKMESLHLEVSDFLHIIEKNVILSEEEPIKTGVQRHIMEMKDLLKMERNEYEVLLLPVISENGQSMQAKIDILELNRLRRGLLLDAYIWDRRLCYVNSLLKTNGGISKSVFPDSEILPDTRLKQWKAELNDTMLGKSCQDTIRKTSLSSGSPRKSLLSREGRLEDTECNSAETDLPVQSVDSIVDGAGDLDLVFSQFNGVDKGQLIAKAAVDMESIDRLPSLASIFSDKIDLAWTGSSELQYDLPQGFTKIDRNRSFNPIDNTSYKKAMSPVRIHSFDSTLRLRQRERAGFTPNSLHLSSFKSADSFVDFTSLLKDPATSIRRAYSQRSPRAIDKLNVVLSRKPTYIQSASQMVSDGVRLLWPQTGYEDDIVVAVYDDEPTSIVSYAMTSQEYVEHVTRKLDVGSIFSRLSDGPDSSSYGLEGSLPSPENHFRFSFDDETSFAADRAKFSVTCYFAKQFAALRKKCCPKDIDYLRSLSRCKRWSAQGGKSNVYFAKTLDERFIIKQVTKTELDSFEEFAPQYFKYLTESLTSGSPTCLAKIVGLYQVSVKGLRGGREVKIDLMVMENLFFQRNISRVYDLKGSLRSRYNPDTSGHNKVLLDSNLIEALHTKPIFVGSKAKRGLERAVWNDTSFLASVDVMDYSLLVGIDEEKKELVIGIIDFLRQYTWDKQLETWVKASGILGGPKNEAPTVISPMQYKKRFRKAMSKYFLTVPDQWSP